MERGRGGKLENGGPGEGDAGKGKQTLARSRRRGGGPGRKKKGQIFAFQKGTILGRRG